MEFRTFPMCLGNLGVNLIDPPKLCARLRQRAPPRGGRAHGVAKAHDVVRVARLCQADNSQRKANAMYFSKDG